MPPYNRSVPSEARRTRDGAGPGTRSAVSRIAHVWGALDRERRLAAVAAVLLFATMFLPWYQQSAVVGGVKHGALLSNDLNAFAVFSFVEAAILLVAAAVLFLLFARAEGRSFHLPGSDGAVIFAAGIWAALLLILRLFDKPGITDNGVAANVGIQWGIFFALGAAGLLAYTGSRLRAARQPEPPLMRPRAAHEHDPSREPGPGAPDREASQSPAPEDAETAIIAARGRAVRDDAPAPPAPRERSRYPPAPRRAPAEPDQLSFEDPQDEG
jgi:hypothetical protein